jgi:hypothetical protein
MTSPLCKALSCSSLRQLEDILGRSPRAGQHGASIVKAPRTDPARSAIAMRAMVALVATSTITLLAEACRTGSRVTGAPARDINLVKAHNRRP